MTNDEVRRELRAQKDGYIDRLLQYDQLTQEINEGVVFQGFKEPTLQFRPTYKYDYGTDNYDTSERRELRLGLIESYIKVKTCIHWHIRTHL